MGDKTFTSIYSISQALKIAKEKGLDLVEINSKVNPSICKILEYKKFLYEQRKKNKYLRSRQEKINTKEIRLSPYTGDHDLEFKINNAKKFLKSKEKVKFTILFKGRSIIYKDQGEILMLKCAKSLEKEGKVDNMPLMDGKKMIMVVSPKNKK